MTTTAFNPTDYLQSDNDIREYIAAALEDDDPRVLLVALRHVAELKGGIAQLAKSTQLNRETLYRTLSLKGNPRLETIHAILDALGLKLTIADKAA